MKFKLSVFCLVAAVLVCSCERSVDSQPVVNLVEMSYHYSEQPDSVLAKDSVEIAALLKVVGDSTLEQWSRSRAVVIFSPDVNRVFPSLDPVEMQLGNILCRAEQLGLDFPDRSYAAVAYGKPEAILFVDSVMLIALNHFLGADYPGYAGLPEYMKAVKTPEQLPYAMAEALCGTQYAFEGGEQTTLLERMLYEGALTFYKLQLVRDSEPAGALGYNNEEFDRLMKDEREIWNSIVREKLLFDTSETTSERFCAPAPFVSLAGMRYPGRVGRFIGWRIAESFHRKHPDELMLSPDFYKGAGTLQESGY